MAETWYVLEDGSVGDPDEVAPDKDGVRRHKNGRAVAMAPHGPRSRSVDAEVERAKAKPAATEAADKPPERAGPPQTRTRDMKPEESSPNYKTR